MSQNDDISLEGVSASNANEQRQEDPEQDISRAEQSDSRQWESKKNRVRALVGAAVSQLPIWGN
jgi:hypothetical protein